ncbi:MAG: hypothetical protein ACI814_001787, partial [Mariniblastus sp.]
WEGCRVGKNLVKQSQSFAKPQFGVVVQAQSAIDLRR